MPADRCARNRQQRTAILSPPLGSGETTLAKTFKRMQVPNRIQASFNKIVDSKPPALLRNAMENPSPIPLMVSIESFSCYAEAKFTLFSCCMPAPSK